MVGGQTKPHKGDAEEDGQATENLIDPQAHPLSHRLVVAELIESFGSEDKRKKPGEQSLLVHQLRFNMVSFALTRIAAIVPHEVPVGKHIVLPLDMTFKLTASPESHDSPRH